MVHLPIKQEEKRIINAGDFEYETYVSRAELVEFLRGIANQIEKGNEITVSSSEWEMKFDFTEPIGIEVELEDSKSRKLEIEIKFWQRAKITTQA